MATLAPHASPKPRAPILAGSPRQQRISSFILGPGTNDLTIFGGAASEIAREDVARAEPRIANNLIARSLMSSTTKRCQSDSL